MVGKWFLWLLWVHKCFSLEISDEMMREGYKSTVFAIEKIEKEWEIEKYPNFLHSLKMHTNGWELLKNRFEKKILEAFSTGRSDFDAGFMGSSVTAGHDSLFSQSFPVLIAIGNNPCMPYDLCPLTFAGAQTDLVHWEQTYNCGFGDSVFILEKFIRQSLSIPSHPIIVFTDSSTPNWRQSNCPTDLNTSLTLSSQEINLYHLSRDLSGIKKITTETNQDIYRKFGFMGPLIRQYGESAGLQFWDHTDYERYKCRGPYISTWGDGCVKWHPSVSGHKLRAAHHSYFWLHIWKDAILSIQSRRKLNLPLSDILKDVTKEYDEFQMKYKDLLKNKPLISSPVVDNIQCYTNFEPHTERSFSLSNLVLANSNSSTGWKETIFENLLRPGVIAQANIRGYLDYKHLYYGNIHFGMLSLKIHVRQEGHVYLCEGPSVFGKLANGFVHLWEANLQIYKTTLSSKLSSFEFHQDDSLKLTGTHTKRDELCLQLIETFSPGHYVITLVPTKEQMINIAFVLIP